MMLGLSLALTKARRSSSIVADILARYPGVAALWPDLSLTSSGYLFQLSTGATPVTATGQSVGFLPDRSQGLVLGAERIGTFAAAGATGRNANSTVTALTDTSITVSAVASGTYGPIFSNIAAVSGKTYKCTLTASTSAATRSTTFAFGGVNYSVNITPTPTDLTWYVVATSTSAPNFFISALGAGETFTVSNFSIKELPGYHAIQATSAARPTLQTVSSRNVLRGDGSDDRLVTSLIPGTSTTIIVAARGDTASRVIVGTSDNGAARSALMLDASGRLAGRVGSHAETTIFESGGPDLRTVPFVAALRYNGSTVELWRRSSGVLTRVYDAAQSGVPTTVNPYYIGTQNVNGVASGFWAGDSYDLLVINAALTDAEMAAVATQFAV